MSVLGGRRVAALCALFALGLTACGSSDKPNYSSNPPVSSTPVTSPTPTDTITQNSPSNTSIPPSTPATSVPTTGPNVSPGEQPPTLAAVGRTDTDQGAVAFAYYWMKTIDWGYATVSSALPRTAFDPICTGCTAFMQNYDDAAAKGIHFSGGRITIGTIEIIKNDGRNGAQRSVGMNISVGELQDIDSSGKVTATEEAHPTAQSQVWLRWEGSQWKVVAWQIYSG